MKEGNYTILERSLSLIFKKNSNRENVWKKCFFLIFCQKNSTPNILSTVRKVHIKNKNFKSEYYLHCV